MHIILRAFILVSSLVMTLVVLGCEEKVEPPSAAEPPAPKAYGNVNLIEMDKCVSNAYKKNSDIKFCAMSCKMVEMGTEAECQAAVQAILDMKAAR
jgi:hypothetical protein